MKTALKGFATFWACILICTVLLACGGDDIATPTGNNDVGNKWDCSSVESMQRTCVFRPHDRSDKYSPEDLTPPCPVYQVAAVADSGGYTGIIVIYCERDQ